MSSYSIYKRINTEVARREISELTIKELIAYLKGRLVLPNACRNSKTELLDFILSSASNEQIIFLQQLGKDKQEDIAKEKEVRKLAAKRKRLDNQQARRVARRLEDNAAHEASIQNRELPCYVQERDISRFLELPTEDDRKECSSRFLDVTSNKALELGVCGVCAREVSVVHNKLSWFKLSDLSNSNRIIPSTPHFAHDLYEGKLLEPCSVKTNGNNVSVRVCKSCLSELQKDTIGPPSMSLANNLWIGRIPWQLQVLTFAEQLLIAQIYPRVYTFKLFPKKIGGCRNHSNLQRGMQGNVSSYELNMDGIVAMLEGKLMPRLPTILASIVTVTFIGVGQLPKKWLWNTFRVRRQTIADALRWLKKNNPKYYGDIEISDERLCALPEEDVPSEIIDIVHQSTDTGIVDQESDGYVPTEDADLGT